MAVGPDAIPTHGDRLHQRRELESALRQVSYDSRRVFLLHHLAGFTFNEVAGILNVKASAAKLRSSSAVRALRAILKSQPGGRHE